MLRLQNFSFAFTDRPIVQAISLHIEKGGYLSIIGPNGAGKSTLLKCLMRLHENGKTTGDASINGRSIDSYSQKELARNVAYAPQAGGKIPPFTVAELLRLSRYPYASRANALQASDLEAVNRALALTGMEEFSNRRLDALSGGERQKAYLAAALAQETDIMLLDEPASFLDPKHAADLNLLLKKLNREQGLTMIVVTHDLNHPLDAGGHALVLRKGRQVFFGPSARLAEEGVLETAFEHSFTYMQRPKTGQPMVLPDQP